MGGQNAGTCRSDQTFFLTLPDCHLTVLAARWAVHVTPDAVAVDTNPKRQRGPQSVALLARFEAAQFRDVEFVCRSTRQVFQQVAGG